MIKALGLGLICLAFSSTVATAACSVTNVFVNGHTADATDVNTNFNDLATGCAPLTSPNFSGNMSLAAASTGTGFYILTANTTFSNAIGIQTPAATEQAAMSFLSNAGVGWQMGKNTDNSFFVWDTAAARVDLVIGSSGDMYLMSSGGNVGIGTTSPAQKLEVNGQIKVDTLASASGTNLCINANVIASCSSSIRYKENVRKASFGLIEVGAMQPVTFKWKGRNENDFGLIAESVAKINPLFVTYENGKIEGVKYPQLTAVLINAIKELKATNDRQAAEIGLLQTQQAANLHTMRADEAAQLGQLRAQLMALQRLVKVRTAQR